MERRFFTILAACAGTRQQENQLSRTFEACFGQSPAFRRAILGLIWRACRLQGTPPRSDWVCEGQPRTPRKGGGAPDLRISQAGSSSDDSAPTFYLESKVEAPLTLSQLQKYKRKGCDYLVAVTKRHPEVLPADIQRAGVFAIRWQDVHRQVNAAVGRGAVERFLLTEFVAYLEELQMAYRERVSKRDVEKLAKVFYALRSPAGGHVTMLDSFRTAESVAELLENVRVRIQEKHRPLRKWGNARPYCGVTRKDGVDDAYIGWNLQHPTGRAILWLALGFPVPSSAGAFIDIWLQTTNEKYAKRSLRHFLTKKSIDEDKVYAFAEGQARLWKLVS